MPTRESTNSFYHASAPIQLTQMNKFFLFYFVLWSVLESNAFVIFLNLTQILVYRKKKTISGGTADLSSKNLNDFNCVVGNAKTL